MALFCKVVDDEKPESGSAFLFDGADVLLVRHYRKRSPQLEASLVSTRATALLPDWGVLYLHGNWRLEHAATVEAGWQEMFERFRTDRQLLTTQGSQSRCETETYLCETLVSLNERRPGS